MGSYADFRMQCSAYLESVTLPPCVETPVRLEITFVCKKPKKPANSYPKGDVDNYVKAIMDSVQGHGFIKDDRQVVTLWAQKRYQEPDEEPHIQLTFYPELP